LNTYLHAPHFVVLPLAISPVAVALMWKYMFNSTYGVLNFLLSHFGIREIDWLGSLNWSLATVIIVDIWQWTPFVILIMLAGIEAIPKNVIDMGKVDGANNFRMFRFIIFPSIKYFIILTFLLRAIDAFKIFDTVYVLTGGGPGSSSETLALFGYKLAFNSFKTGLASAESIILLLIVLFLSVFLIITIKTLLRYEYK
jgi:multiple sugar transport system permease protein